MTEEDLLNCFMMFKSTTGASPEECYQFAKEMLEIRKPKEKDDEEDTGIASIAKRSYRRKS